MNKDQEDLADALDYWAAAFMRGEDAFFKEEHHKEIAQILYDSAEEVRKTPLNCRP
tara:strand:- start:363 stop:530 length:168 start_codon:yes stop_codon:yes gene_type:complete